MPYWTGGETMSQTIPELLACEACDEPFIRRVRYTTTKEHCGKKERTKIDRFGAWPRCGACDELAQARRHEKDAARCRERAAEKRASQRRNIAASTERAKRPQSSNWENAVDAILAPPLKTKEGKP